MGAGSNPVSSNFFSTKMADTENKIKSGNNQMFHEILVDVLHETRFLHHTLVSSNTENWHKFNEVIQQKYLSYDVASESYITSCNKINKPLVVYRFW